MPTIFHEIYIETPIATCFDLARNVDIHIETTSHTKEEAVAGVTAGVMELGDEVTWEATHFGKKQKLTAKIIEMEKPYRLTDAMVKGAFYSFIHTHEFLESGSGTVMKDRFVYRPPLGILGILEDRLFSEKYMERFIVNRSLELKDITEEKKT